MLAMEKAGTALPDEKNACAIKKYFEKVYPDMDFERVYASDMKKMVRWFDILKKNKVEVKLPEIEEEDPEKTEIPAPVVEENAAETPPPAKKTTRKKNTE